MKIKIFIPKSHSNSKKTSSEMANNVADDGNCIEHRPSHFSKPELLLRKSGKIDRNLFCPILFLRINYTITYLEPHNMRTLLLLSLKFWFGIPRHIFRIIPHNLARKAYITSWTTKYLEILMVDRYKLLTKWVAGTR